jgi:hypothetical protein
MGYIWSGIWNDGAFLRLSERDKLSLLGLMSLANQRGLIRMTEKAVWATLDPEEKQTFEQFQGSLNALREGETGPGQLMSDMSQPFVGSPSIPGRFVTLDTDRVRPSRRLLPARIRRAVVERDGMVCQLCGHDIPNGDLHIDHIYPVARGGGDELDNLQAAHSRCNISKGARI